MTDSNVLPPYPQPSKPITGGIWPANEQVQYIQQPYIQPGQVHVIYPVHIDPAIAQIRDWLPWSIVNIFIGWLLVGIIPLIFSNICRSYKRSNNLSGARTMSTLALVFNILVTLGGIAGWVALIVVLVIANRAATTANCLITWPNTC